MEQPAADIEQRVLRLESAVSSLARSAPVPSAILQPRPVTVSSGPSVQWLASRVTITTSASATGWTSFVVDGVPSTATMLLLEVFGGTAADAAQPLAELTFRADEGLIEVVAKSQRASSAAGDQSGQMAWVPVKGARVQYLVSSDWAVLEIYAVGYWG